MLIAMAFVPLLALAAPKQLIDLQVYPKDANLFTKRGKQLMVVQAKYSDSTSRDVTAEAKFSFADPKFAKLEKNTLLPLADGETTLKVEFGGRALTVPVKVKDAAKDRTLAFSVDVMPVFLKSGCNTGSCHGSTSGKDKFRLSLFGFDPQGDYNRLTREEVGRRINIARPDDALIVEKSLGRVTHTGGKRFEKDSWEYRAFIEWLSAGAPSDPPKTPTVVDLEIYPLQAVLEGDGAKQQLTVRAKYSDGTDRDVTEQTMFISNNSLAAAATPAGLVTSGKPGEAFIMARFDQITTGTQILSIPNLPNYKFPSEPAGNYIDPLVYAKHKKVRITPSGMCDDNTFIRRIYLDVIGKLPERAAVEKFVADKSSTKRAQLVDELLGRPEFTKMWVMKWAELLQIRTDNNRFQYKNAILYFEWLRSQFEKNRPMNEIVQDLLGAKGGTFSNPAGNFYQIQRDSKKLMENTAQIFMGMRIQCAQCHNHPFDRWKMDDYYSFANFFSQVGRKGSEDNREIIIYNAGSGAVRHPVGNRVLPPKFLGGEVPDVAGKDRREVLAKWLASDDNPFFAKNMANIVWGHFMGVGIVEPVDDVRISNPPSNPELLDELGRRFSKSGYNFKQLVRDICNSRTYQRTVQSNDSNRDDTRNFAKASIRRVRAEVLLDIISQVTDTQNKFRGLPSGSSAVEIVDGRTSTFFLTTFGRASRDTVCSCEVALEPNLSQALHLLNGSTVNQKCTQGGIVAKALAAKQTPGDIIDDLYLRCLSRKPTAAEKEKLMPFFGDKDYSETDVLNDLFWAILNSKEFIFNH